LELSCGTRGRQRSLTDRDKPGNGGYAGAPQLRGVGVERLRCRWSVTTALQRAVAVGNNTGIRRHLLQLQLIADRPGNNGTRATATQGDEDSVKYVEQQLATAGTDFATIDASGSGASSGAPLVSSSGCETTDFPATLTGRVALIQRGTCDFGLKAKNAQDRGALGVIIFNEGTIGAPDRNGLINGTVGGYGVTIPVLEATYAAGRFLHDAYVQGKNPTVSMSATTRNRVLQTRNVIAETTTGRTDRTITTRCASSGSPVRNRACSDRRTTPPN
jgi:hypothetical protein